MARSNSTRLSAEELRQRKAAMMDEDTDPARLPATTTRGRKAATASTSPAKQGKKKNTQRSSTPPPSARASTSSAVAPASPSIAIKFAGKVYRTLDTQMDGVTYSSSGDFLGEPDEEIGDVERERADEKRRDLQRRMLVEQSSPDSKGKGKRRADFLEDEVEVEGARSRKARAEHLATPVKQQLSSSIHRQRSLSPPAAPPRLAAPFAFRDSTSTASSGPLVPLPEPLSDLLKLHSAIEGALIMHLSTSGSSVASTSSDFDQDGRATVRIPNLIEMAELGRMVRGARQQFGAAELERLVWAWEGCGETLEDDEDELRVVRTDGEGLGEEVGGLGFLVSRKRVGKGNNIQATHGIGISVSIKSNPQLPKFELLPHSPSQKDKVTPPSPSSVGRGREGMNVVALWTQGKDARREELTRRFRAWGRRCAREEQARVNPIYSPSTLPSFPYTLPDIPRATLPALSPSLPTAIAGSLSPSPKKKVPSHDVFGPAVPIAGAKDSNSVLMLLEGKQNAPKSGLKAAERRRQLEARLAAKAAAAASAPSTNHAFLSTLSGGTFPSSKKSLKPEKTAATDHQTIEKEMYKRNAMVSRLGNVADVIVMLSLKHGGRSILLHEVSSAVSNSPLVKIGEDEAQESLVLLCELFPSFASIKSVDRQEWLSLGRDAKAIEVKQRVAEELEMVRSRSNAYA